MDNRTILQVPLSSSLKSTATQVAEDMGFSSLQELVRILLTQFAHQQLTISVTTPIKLSAKNEKRYAKMMTDATSGKVKLKSFHNVDELMSALHSEG